MTDYGKSVYGGPGGGRMADCAVLGESNIGAAIRATPPGAKIAEAMSIAQDVMTDVHTLLDQVLGPFDTASPGPSKPRELNGLLPQLREQSDELREAASYLRARLAQVRGEYFGGR